MASQPQTVSVKTVLLLQPMRLLHRHPVLQLLQVSKKDNGMVEMEELPVMQAIVAQHLKGLDAEARKALMMVSESALQKEKLLIEKRFELQRTATDWPAFYDKAMARYFLQVLGQLKQYGQQLSWYHRLPHGATNKIVTAPCVYHPFAVMLSFCITVKNDTPQIDIWVEKGREKTLLSEYRRFYFLLEKDHQYLHLPLRCYELLEWLDEHAWDEQIMSALDYARNVANHIRQQGFDVQADALEEAVAITTAPARRVLLSELNNAFLMLTPQFVYEDCVIEGAYEPITKYKQDEVTLHIHRVETAEQSLVQFLQGLHPNFARQYNGYYYLSFADAQKKGWFLKVYHQLLDADIELRGMDLLKHFKYAPYKPETKLQILQELVDVLQVSMQVSFGKEKIPLADLQKMLLNGQKAVMLKDGSLGVLGEEWLHQYSGMVKHSRVQGDQLQVPRWLAMSLDATDDNALQLTQVLPEQWWQQWTKWHQQEDALYALPQTLQVQALRPYQQKGYEWLRLLAEAGGSGCLADDMGLGKTLQTIAFLAHRFEQDNTARFLVVCPASLMYNWQQELEKFAPVLRSIAYHGAQRKADWITDEHYQVLITSYGTLRQDIDLFAAVTFNTVVIDESHYIKNPVAQITRAITQLQAPFRIALSGTPVMNGTVDLYAQLNFLLPGMLGSKEFFRREYAYPIEQQKDEEKAAALQKMIAPFILRRTKEQVAADLPEKTESILWCHMGHDQRMAYESLKEEIRGSVLLEIEQKGLPAGKLSVLAGLTKLRQLCNSPALVKDADLFCEDSIKTDVLMEELKQIIPQHKALVFSQFTGMLDVLEQAMNQHRIVFSRIDGSTPAHKRQELVNAFQSADTDASVMLISLKAGNAGLNLTAADYVFLVDPWWNAAVENQAIDRTHRIGQTNPVFAYRMICKHTVEEKILQLKDRKKKLAESLITTEDGLMQELSIEDVAFLFQ